MHPHTPAEADQLMQDTYGVYTRLRISTTPIKPADGILVEPSLGYDPLESVDITADLDQPLVQATIRLHLGQGIRNLSPYMSSGFGEFFSIDSSYGDFTRPMFDPGIYIGVEARCISQKPYSVAAPPPRFQGKGPVTLGGPGSGPRTPQWPAHQVGDVALLIIKTANQAATLATANGFVSVLNSPQSIGSAGTGVRLTLYWCRATTNHMVAPVVADPGNMAICQILTWRGCIQTGNPWYDVAGSTTAGSSTVTMPSIVGTPANMVFIVAHGIDSSAKNLVTWNIPTVPHNSGDVWTSESTTAGVGGGFSASGYEFNGVGGVPGKTGTLSASSAQARLSLALKPPATIEVSPTDAIPWRLIFAGRIDSADPADGNTLELHCRDQFCDLMDRWIDPPLGQNGYPMEGDQIDDILRNILNLRPPEIAALAQPFAVMGTVTLGIEDYLQEPMPVLLAMRETGLQNGWDLRGRFGTAPYGEDEWVLTYYEPDRPAGGGRWIVGPTNYYGISAFPKNRDAVRNIIRVTPADPPRTPVEVSNEISKLRYGIRWMAIAEDLISGIRTGPQAQALAEAVLSDLEEPAVTAEVPMRFLPFIEVNDLVQLEPNGIHLDTTLVLAVSGYTHSLTKDSFRTTLRTRLNPAAANEEWRMGEPKTHFVSTAPPTGTAPEGSTHEQVD